MESLGVDSAALAGGQSRAADAAARLRFIKGHGTGNDFVVVDDLQGASDLTAEQVAAICDRRFGIGADGLLRVIERDGRFFMDYRNADGSIAETCGNGLRVFCTHLFRRGWLPAGDHEVGTHGGVVSVAITASGEVTVNMGKPGRIADSCDVTTNEGRVFQAVGISMPNPHCVAIVESLEDAGALSTKPLVPAGVFPEQANVEFVRVIDASRIEMRVWERGVGETLSCGSGACAAAAAAADALGLVAPWSLRVDVPGGTLNVAQDAAGDLHLSGPAVLVASGEVDVDSIVHQRGRGTE